MDEQFNRRNFLSKFGVTVAGAVVIGPQLSGCVPIDTSATPAARETDAPDDTSTESTASAAVATIGVYVPQAKSDSEAVEQFVAGMTAARELQDGQARPTRLVVQRFAGAAPRPAQLRAFIADYNLDAVVALMNTTAAWPLVEVLRQSQTPMLVASAGLELASAQTLSSPWAFVLSGGGWEASYAAGAYSARRYGGQAVIAAMSKEASYDAVFAFHEGFHDVSGRPPAVELIDAPAFDRSTSEVLDAIWSHRPRALYALVSGEAGDEFLRALDAHRGLSAVPVITTGFTGSALASVDESFVGWSKSVDSAQSEGFVEAMASKTARAATGFSALGADALGWLGAALSSQPEGQMSTEAIRLGLAQAQFDGLRGRYQVDEETGRLVAPIYRQAARSAAIEQVALPRDVRARLLSKLAHPRSGSIDVYLG